MDKIKNTLQSIPQAFVLFGRAFKNAKKDFWISIQVLFWVSLVLSILFYFVEHAAQPDEYRNWWQAIVWTLTRYIGDPGHFAGNGPITLTGRHIDSIIGILKILFSLYLLVSWPTVFARQWKMNGKRNIYRNAD